MQTAKPNGLMAGSVKSLLIASASFTAFGTASAQDEGVSETIIVTARRTAEDVQDVPGTVNVIDARRLENADVSNTSEIRNVVSNLQWEDNGGGTTENRITVRGLSSNASRQGFDPGVGIYLDDVYIGDTTGFNGALLDIERVEVLKGPQGTLFGRNTTAGAISIHTRRPSASQQFAELSLRAGNYDLREGRLVWNVPIADTVAFKVSGVYRDRAGYQENVVDGSQSLNSETFYGARAQLLWTPTNDLDVLLTADYFRNDDLQNVASCFGGIACGFNPTFESIFDDVAADNNSSTERTMWSTSLNVDWAAPGGYEWTSITAYQNREYHNDQDNDFTPVEFTRAGYHEPDDWQFSQELRVATPREHAVRGVAGLYYYHEDRSISIPQYIGSEVAAFFALPADTPPLTTTTDAEIQTTSWAAFGQAQFDITPSLIGELGVRYTADSKDFSYVQRVTGGLADWPLAVRGQFGLLDPSDFPTPAPGSLPAGSIGPLEASDDWAQVTSLASLTWRASEDLNFYVRYSQGYKSGGFQSTTVASHFDGPPLPGNLVVDSRPNVPFDNESVEAWEAGLRSEFFDRRLRVNLTGFWMNYSDIQLQYTDPATRAKTVLNAGEATSSGLELEISAALFDGFSLDAAIGVQDAELDSVSVVIPGIDAGDSLPYAPDTSASLTATYRHSLWGDWEFVTSLTGSYRSEMWLDLGNTIAGPGVPVAFLSPELTLVSGRIGLEAADNWGVYLWGDNITDERVITGAIRPALPFAAEYFTLNTPRTWGIEIRAQF